MAIGGDFKSRTVSEIDGDARGYLRAVQDTERADERAARKRDAQIVATLKEQGRLSEATFLHAKAVGGVADSWDEVPQKVDVAGKAVEVLGKRVKAMGLSILSGFGAGLIAGVAGGSISSLIQKAFDPPTDQQLEQWSRMDNEITKSTGLWGQYARGLKDWAKEEIANRRQVQIEKEGLDGLAKTLEGITHDHEIDVLVDQLNKLDDKFRTGQIPLDTYKQAWIELKNEILKARGAAGEFTDATLGNDGITLIAKRQVTGKFTPTRIAGLKSGPLYVPGQETSGHGGSGESPYDDIESLADYKARKAHADWLAVQDAIKEANRLAVIRQIQGDYNVDGSELHGSIEDAKRNIEEVQHAFEKAAEDYKNESPLERLFGPADEFNAYRDLFVGLTDAVGASYEALVTGSESAGTAFRKFVAGSLLALGKKSAIEALYQLALVWADPKEAGRHLVAAAKLGAVAVAAGVGAAGLGGGGGSGGSASAAGGGYAASGSSSSGNPGPTVENHYHFYAHPQANSNPSDRQRNAQEIIRDANGGGGYGVLRG